jgi:soluble lytic murein transglycosylase-like protein
MTNAMLAIIALAEVSQGIPNGLLKSVCTVESNLNPDAVAKHDGAVNDHSHGLCQVKIGTARQFEPNLTVRDLYDPRTNARVAAKYLRWQYDRYNSWDRALVAYNRGTSTGPNNSYSRKVKRKYQCYRKSNACN